MFVKTKRKAKSIFNSNEKAKFAHMSRNSPRKFWKYIKKLNKNKCNSNTDININDFKSYFETVSNVSNIEFDSETFVHGSIDELHIDQLDRPFSIEEISKVLSTLKRNKS